MGGVGRRPIHTFSHLPGLKIFKFVSSDLNVPSDLKSTEINTSVSLEFIIYGSCFRVIGAFSGNLAINNLYSKLLPPYTVYTPSSLRRNLESLHYYF